MMGMTKSEMLHDLNQWGYPLNDISYDELEFLNKFHNSSTLKVEILLLKRRLDKLENK